ncbi:serine/threonine-protein kinase [Nonomuraea jiangxiensis]|uniref:Serine/threonine protein kinase n=1 Tax=Nonomuraea jiangxiensis TaxID=633440 RepID=A0A1G9MKB1_9ACTN|nr:serine/threonine-protein kinase [Nonomuraea jiangxiensis]SDL74564.1 Serine/threonine protein kinase [Nonomuraea jiangxiensis]
MRLIAPLRPGDPARIGRYRLLGRLGAGGQGVAFLAVGDDGRQVAVKALPRISGEAARRRMAAELDLLRRVSGFCTVQVLDADPAADPPHLVTEYVPGPSLAELVQREGPRRGEALERLAVATATALTAIHRAGVAHLDLTPGNVIMGPDGPRVVDFGLARAVGGPATDADIAGTPAFIAPEQLAGDPPTTAADVFSWAATLAYAATGRHPFGDDAVPAVVYRVLHREPDLGTPAELGGFLRAILQACLAKDPALRPSAQELLYHLADRTPMKSAGAPARGRAWKRGWVVAVAAVVAIAGGAGAAAWRGWPGEGGGPAGVATRDALAPPPLYAQQAEEAARRAYGIVNGFGYRTLDENLQAVDEATTGRANVEYTGRLRDQAQRIRDGKMAREAVAAESGIVAARTDRVVVLVWGQMVTTGDAPGDYRRGGVVMEMRRVVTAWKLDHVWLANPRPDSAEMTTGEWPSGRATTLLSAASGDGVRAVALDAVTPAGARVFRLGTDGTVSRLTMVPAGGSFRVESSRELGAS